MSKYKILALIVLTCLVAALVGCGGSKSLPQTSAAIAWPTPAAISYGTALSATQLNAVATGQYFAPISGTYTYTPAAGTVLEVGPQTLNVSFVPSDTTHYTAATASVTLTVTKANPAITWTTPVAINVGTALSSAQLNATTTMPGTLTYSPVLGTVPAAGSQTLSATFVPTDSAHYATVTSTVTLQVNTAAQACASFTGITIPATAFGLATTGATVTSATLVPAATANAGVEYCKIVGAIHPVTVSETVNSTVIPTPDIGFNVALPTSWNTKTIHGGGGGFDGSVPAVDAANTVMTVVTPNVTILSPLARGYVVVGDDSGHVSSAMPQALWNQEALRNFGREAIKKTHDAAIYLVQMRYGAKPNYNYFMGGSQGGHEALIAASFYPNDFEGVVVGYPAYDLEAMHPGSIDYGKTLYNAHTASAGFNYTVGAVAGEGWISRAQMAAATNLLQAHCDALDGAADGIISNPGAPACVTFRNSLLVHGASNPMRCTAAGTGAATDGVHFGALGSATRDNSELCFSDYQIETLARLSSRYPLYNFNSIPTAIEGGIKSYAKWGMLDGFWFAKDITKDNGQEDFGGNTVVGGVIQTYGYNNFSAFQASFPTTDQVQMLTQQLWTASQVAASFDITQWTTRLQQVSSYVDTSSIDYEAFRGRGGKMIHYAGSADVSITSYNSVDLALRMRGDFFTAQNSSGDLYIGNSPFYGSNFDLTWNQGVPQRDNVTISGGIVDDFYTFYVIPGMGHGHGYYAAQVDWLTALEQWRERDIAPANSLISTDNTSLNTSVTPNTGHATLGQRPVCYFPYYPKFTSTTSTDTTLAANYTCTKLDAYINLK